jgi:hypothetical protein
MFVEVTLDSEAGDGAAMLNALAHEHGMLKNNATDWENRLPILPADGDDVAATIGRVLAWIFVNRPHHVACSVRVQGSTAEAVRFERYCHYPTPRYDTARSFALPARPAHSRAPPRTTALGYIQAARRLL